MRLVLQHEAVTEYLTVEHPALGYGGIEPQAVVLLRNNTSSGRCAVGLHIVLDGKDHFVKVSVDMLQTLGEVTRSMALELYGEERAP